MGSPILNDENKSFLALRNSLVFYAPISDKTWEALKGISKFRSLPKNTLLYSAGNIPQSYAYVYQGLIRCFACDESGKEYNKNFFDEGMFPGAMTALLTSSPSMLSFETIEADNAETFCGFRSLNLPEFRDHPKCMHLEGYDDH